MIIRNMDYNRIISDVSRGYFVQEPRGICLVLSDLIYEPRDKLARYSQIYEELV